MRLIDVTVFTLTAVVASTAVYLSVRPFVKIQATVFTLIISLLVGLVGAWIGIESQLTDTEILNGEIISKTKEEVSCEHSYQCNCTTSCSGLNCSTVCQTCYEHTHDYDWNLNSNVGTIKIQRIDDQGKKTPPRWSAARVGEPVAVTHEFRNYVRASDSSLFYTGHGTISGQFEGQIPQYPMSIYDYHRLDRVLSAGVQIDSRKLSNILSEKLKALGPARQANVIVVFTKHGPAYAEAQYAHWFGGKKNDVIVTVGVDGEKIAWADVRAWTDSQLFKVQLRDRIVFMETFNPEKVLDEISDEVMKSFSRKSFKDFEYLKDDLWLDWYVYLIVILIQVGAALIIRKVQ
jgi:hypothetical protein